MTHREFVKRLKAFLKRHHMTPTSFSKAATINRAGTKWHYTFYKRLVEGKPRKKTIDRTMAFMNKMDGRTYSD